VKTPYIQPSGYASTLERLRIAEQKLRLKKTSTQAEQKLRKTEQKLRLWLIFPSKNYGKTSKNYGLTP